MDTQTANMIGVHILQLRQLCITYHSRFKDHKNLRPGSSPDAWALYHSTVQKQIEIASLLDREMLDKPRQRGQNWWDSGDIPEFAIVHIMTQVANELIVCCAYDEQSEQPGNSPIILSWQMVLVGMLHPTTRQLALGKFDTM